MPEVNCTVSNCEYWRQGHLCGAKSILITAGSNRGKDPNGDNAAILSDTPISNGHDSYCWTFRVREEAYIEDDDEVEADLMAHR
jgi:hypothetical protein